MLVKLNIISATVNKSELCKCLYCRRHHKQCI